MAVVDLAHLYKLTVISVQMLGEATEEFLNVIITVVACLPVMEQCGKCKVAEQLNAVAILDAQTILLT